MISEFCEQKYVEKVHLKLKLAQSTKQESPKFFTVSSLKLLLDDRSNANQSSRRWSVER